MSEFFTEYKEQILSVASFVTLPFLVFIISLSFVYLFGRMLLLVKSERAKNLVAYVSIISSYIFYFFFYNPQTPLLQRVWYILIYTAISVIFYVLIGFKLYSRVDAFLDKFAADKEERRATKAIAKKKNS